MLTLNDIIAGESRNVEFKETLTPKSLHYLKTVVAFANTLGGKIIIGVEDQTHRVVGIPNDTISNRHAFRWRFTTIVSKSLRQGRFRWV